MVEWRWSPFGMRVSCKATGERATYQQSCAGRWLAGEPHVLCPYCACALRSVQVRQTINQELQRKAN